MPHPPLTFSCLIYPGFMSLDVVGPLQVMSSANEELVRQGRAPLYTLRLLAEAPGPVACSAGFETLAQAAYADEPLSGTHTLIVPGGQGVAGQLDNAGLLGWLQRAEPVVVRLGSVCSGALLLAQAGLLDSRPATTHWERVAEFRARHPGIDLQGDRLHTYDPTGVHGDAHVFTSAGVSSGIDLALALVEHDLGRALALAVARRLVIYLRRPGGQAQFSRLVAPDAEHTPRLTPLLEWIPGHLDEDMSLEALAVRSCMAPRTLTRVFQRELGTTPARYVERVRVETASALLSHGQASVTTVARLCGFQHPETLRRAFHRHLSVSPQAFAQRFGPAGGADAG
ncbi:GlxA family transcriptional regulator [Paracidovorax cattleyae]|uniref:GlxA family transcriptional regulator n=1 Tax=Paracidovorax cattleyae TaxID=80868 RepID=UPI0018AFDC4E|nr:helix-turn-helix domain-containing protein [Paracidovorax cattleyae]MBF9266586.1 helix-turn-helix domain-containing protein [Paracidovorax cattleyae]